MGKTDEHSSERRTSYAAVTMEKHKGLKKKGKKEGRGE